MTRKGVSPGRGDPGPVVSAATDPSIAPDDELPVVTGWVYGPCAGRRRYLIVVRRCCHCGHAHRHTSEVLAPTYARGCPPTGRRYRIRSRIERDTTSGVIGRG